MLFAAARTQHRSSSRRGPSTVGLAEPCRGVRMRMRTSNGSTCCKRTGLSHMSVYSHAIRHVWLGMMWQRKIARAQITSQCIYLYMYACMPKLPATSCALVRQSRWCVMHIHIHIQAGMIGFITLQQSAPSQMT